MPKSKVRRKNDFTVSAVSRTLMKVKAGPSSVWFALLFIGLMLIGPTNGVSVGAIGVKPLQRLNWMAHRS